MIARLAAGLIAVVLLASAGQAAEGPARTPRDLYEAAAAREQAIHGRKGGPAPTLQEYRAAVSAYDAVVRQFPQSGYVDNALWQGGNLANEAFDRFGQSRDRATARRLLRLLVSDYPVSPFVKKARAVLQQMDDRDAAATRSAEAPAVPSARQPSPPSSAATAAPRGATRITALQEVSRTSMPDRVRVTLDLDGSTTYRSERVEDPPRVFLDLQQTKPGRSVALGTLSFKDTAADYVRIGLQPDGVTRVVIGLEGVSGYHIAMFDRPYRIVIDCDRARPVTSPPDEPAAAPAPPARPRATPPTAEPPPLRVRPVTQQWRMLPVLESFDASLLHPPGPQPPPVTAALPAAAPAQATVPPPPPQATSQKAVIPPAAPNTGLRGPYSMTRQLGLGVSKIVIDPGHGGHDPGALGPGVNEADVVLDVALRLEKLLKQAGVEVVMTRRTDEYVPLEERPALARREQADLFLSIHANANRTRSARGIETYYLNFATDPAAEAVAARENAATTRTITNLPDILKAITLNNKLDESRTFAGLIQQSMATELKRANTGIKNLGVKQAPFVVLIGSDMPSVLVEIAFITNPQEARLLKTEAYRQKIAQALFDAVRGYQKSLKSEPVAARQ
jgi:N-acetylmuramoyl-L-alanine amidase